MLALLHARVSDTRCTNSGLETLFLSTDIGTSPKLHRESGGMNYRSSSVALVKQQWLVRQATGLAGSGSQAGGVSTETMIFFFSLLLLRVCLPRNRTLALQPCVPMSEPTARAFPL